MIIKIRSSFDSGEWTLFDDCHQVRYDTTRIVIKPGVSVEEAIQEATGWHGTETVLHVNHDTYLSGVFDEAAIGQWACWFDSDGRGHAIFTDKPMWLMTDDGETIEPMR